MLEPEITPPSVPAEHPLLRLARHYGHAAEAKGYVFGEPGNPENVRRAASDAASNAYDVLVRAVLHHTETEAAITDELIRRHTGGVA